MKSQTELQVTSGQFTGVFRKKTTFADKHSKTKSNQRLQANKFKCSHFIL